MIDLGYPAVARELAIDDAAGRELQAAGSAAQRSTGVIAHRVVTEALANQHYVVAERAARVACELLPGDERAVLDLARVLDARGRLRRPGRYSHRSRTVTGRRRSRKKQSGEHG